MNLDYVVNPVGARHTVTSAGVSCSWYDSQHTYTACRPDFSATICYFGGSSVQFALFTRNTIKSHVPAHFGRRRLQESIIVLGPLRRAGYQCI